MEYSSGIAIIYDNKILLAHPKGASINRMWGIPKGKIEKGESKKEAAVRETWEEVGIKIDPVELKEYKEIVYKNKKNKTYKRVYYYVHTIKTLNEIGLKNLIVEKSQLQPTEINDAKFMTKEEAKDIIFWRFEEMLNYIQ